MDSVEKTFYKLGWLFLAVLVPFAFLLPHVSSLPCILYTVTGFYCPGCGGTRAFLALLHGHPLQSLWYHPVVLYTAILYIWFMISHTLDHLSSHRTHLGLRFRNSYLHIAAVLILSNWVIKNILLHIFHITL